MYITGSLSSHTSEDIVNMPIYYYVSKKSGKILGFNVDASERLRKIIEMTSETEYEFEEVKLTVERRIRNIDIEIN